MEETRKHFLMQAACGIRAALAQRKIRLAFRIAIAGARVAFWKSLRSAYRFSLAVVKPFSSREMISPTLIDELRIYPPIEEEQSFNSANMITPEIDLLRFQEVFGVERGTALFAQGITYAEAFKQFCDQIEAEFKEAFGERRGAQYFAQGLTYVQALEQECDRLEDEILARKTQSKRIDGKSQSNGLN